MRNIVSLSTINREYAALKALPFYDLLDDILNSKLTKSVPPSPSEIKKVVYSQGVNEPQASSILSSLLNRGFSLIQGYASVVSLNQSFISYQTAGNWQDIDNMRDYRIVYVISGVTR